MKFINMMVMMMRKMENAREYTDTLNAIFFDYVKAF